MLLSLSGVPDLGSRSAKPPLKPTQLSVVVKTASKPVESRAEPLEYSMVRAFAMAAVALLIGTTDSSAQYPASPVPLFPAAPRSFEAAPVPDPGMPGSPRSTGEPETAPGSAGSLTPPPVPEATARVFCQQPVTVRLADPDSV